jgi:hypothetical protein
MAETIAKVEKPDDRLTQIEKALDNLQKILARELMEKADNQEPSESELRDRDHRSHMTMAMTLGSPKDLEKSSDIGSGEEMAWMTSTDIDGQIMSPIFQMPRMSLLGHKISKDRKSREEYKDILSKGFNIQDQWGGIYNSGPAILRKELKKQEEEGPDE